MNNQDQKTIPELFRWLEATAREIPFGEISISLVLHQGNIVRVRKILEETSRLQNPR